MTSEPNVEEPQRKRPYALVALIALCCGGFAGIGWWWTHRANAAPPPPVAVETQPASPKPPPTPKQSLKHVKVTLESPLESALSTAAGSEVGPALAQVIVRTLVWWVEVPRDLLRGDELEAVYELRPPQEPLVHAVVFTSRKTGKTHKAYRFHAPGETHPRFYEPTGDELERRLVGGPLDDYEQVTSLLRDGRRHKGVDFKAPVGSMVKAPFYGTITRRNWNFRGNGNCLELTERGGRRKALFLHLDVLPAHAKVGRKVAPGDHIAFSGNSGRSFAPHLHYQLMTAADKVLDPFTQHTTSRRALSPAQRAAFDAAVQALDAEFRPAIASP